METELLLLEPADESIYMPGAEMCLEGNDEECGEMKAAQTGKL